MKVIVDFVDLPASPTFISLIIILLQCKTWHQLYAV